MGLKLECKELAAGRCEYCRPSVGAALGLLDSISAACASANGEACELRGRSTAAARARAAAWCLREATLRPFYFSSILLTVTVGRIVLTVLCWDISGRENYCSLSLIG